MKGRILSVVIIVCMIFAMIPTTVFAANVEYYYDENGKYLSCESPTEVTADDIQWTEGWYIAHGEITLKNRVEVQGDVHLILSNRANVTASLGIKIQDDDEDVENGSKNSLTIYAQSPYEALMGELNAEQKRDQNGTMCFNAGIGGNASYTDEGIGGTITINGGIIKATSDAGAGIGGGFGRSCGTVTINGGLVTAEGKISGAGIGGGTGVNNEGTVNINGGSVLATGAQGAGIGSGYIDGNSESGGTVNITGGKVTAKSSTGAGIGGGQGKATGGIGETVTISGGNVEAVSENGAGIGGGWSPRVGGAGGSVAITGGTVTAESNTGAGIGGGYGAGSGGAGGSVIITGGLVKATSTQGAGIGGSKNVTEAATYAESENNNYGEAGTFTTGENGNAVIFSSLISDQSEKDNWQGVIFEGTSGMVYGDVTPTESFEIPDGFTLDISESSVLTVADDIIVSNKGTINNNGTIINNEIIKNLGTVTGNGTVQENPVLSTTVNDVKYLDENGEEQNCTSAISVTSDDTKWYDGWYVVRGEITIESRIQVLGDVHLILEDGANLTAALGINVQDDDCIISNECPNSLTIYAQSKQESSMGALLAKAKGDDDIIYPDAAIGGDYLDIEENGLKDEASGTIIINGGKITALGDFGSGIGGASRSPRGKIIINDGVITAKSSWGGAIGGSYVYFSGEEIIINGGTINAVSERGAGIGGSNSDSYSGPGGDITITGGNITAESDTGAGIGGGEGPRTGGSGGNINISGGNIKAISEYGAGIGGGWSGRIGGSGGNITITGGNITADSNTGAGIGGGYGTDFGGGGAGGNITISGGLVKATSTQGAGIGGSKNRVETTTFSESENNNYGEAGTFTTGENGNAVILASKIADQSDKANWHGVIFEGTSGVVYGDVTPTENFEIPDGYTLDIPEDTTLTIAEGITMTNNGVFEISGNINPIGEIECLNHFGGTATCTEQAVCDLCKEHYGELADHIYEDGVCINCGKPEYSYEIGDVNMDGKVDVLDVSSIQCYLVLLPEEVFNEDLADVNMDGIISITDATWIQVNLTKK